MYIYDVVRKRSMITRLAQQSTERRVHGELFISFIRRYSGVYSEYTDSKRIVKSPYRYDLNNVVYLMIITKFTLSHTLMDHI